MAFSFSACIIETAMCNIHKGDNRMRKLSVIVSFMFVFAFCAGLVSCSSDDDGKSGVLDSYIPSELSSKTVDALYVKSESGDYTNGTLNCTTTNSQNPLGCASMPPVPSELVVTDGKFSVQSYEFTKQ